MRNTNAMIKIELVLHAALLSKAGTACGKLQTSRAREHREITWQIAHAV